MDVSALAVGKHVIDGIKPGDSFAIGDHRITILNVIEKMQEVVFEIEKLEPKEVTI